MKVAETKWFGCDVYEVMGSVVLTSGRSMPASKGDNIQRGEGVAIVLLEWAVGAGKNGGWQWKSWSSRIVSVWLKVENKFFHIHVVCCYAPTRAASRENKIGFLIF